MELNQVVKLRPLLLTIFIAIFCAFWVWIVFLANFPIDTRGWAGYVTAILDFLDILGVPLLGIAIISLSCVAIVKRSSPLRNVTIIMWVGAALAFSAWSLSPSGQFNIQWRK